MHPSLRKKFLRNNKNYQHLMERMAKYNDDTLNISVKKDKWSPIQILAHMESVDRLTLQDPHLKSRDWKCSIRSVILKLALSSPLKLKAPVATSENLPDYGYFSEIKGQYDTSCNNWLQFLENLPVGKMHLQVFKHPIVGRISIVQTIDFLNWHFTHHERQIKNLL